MGCGNSSGPGATTQQVTQTTSPPPQVLAAYQNLLNRGTAVANTPLQQWQGPTIAGFNPTQQAAFNEISGAQGSALPYINSAAQYAAQGAAPVFPNVMQFNAGNLAQFQNPYTQQVTQATQNLFDEQNAEQFNQARGAAASAGAFGGDREAVLEAQMAQQQQLAEAPALAQIQQQGFNTAAGLLGQQQQLQLQGMEGDAWRQANAAYQMGGLGNEAQNSLLSGAAAQLQAGTMGQQLQQEQLNVPIEQFYQQQAYPFQTTQFLAGLTEGIAPGEGGTATTTSPGPNAIGQGIGLGALGIGALGSTGAFPSGGQSGWLFKRGGLVPRRASGGLALDADLVPDLSVSYVPLESPGSAIARALGLPTPPAPANAQSPVQSATQGLQALSALKGLMPQSAGGLSPTQFTAAQDQASSNILGDTSFANQSAFGPFADSAAFSPAASDLAASGLSSDALSGLSSDALANIAGGAAGLRRGGLVPHRATGGGLVPHMAAGGDPITTTLDMIPGFDPSSATLGETPDQHNRVTGYVGQGIGDVIGGYFGGPYGAMAGGMAGKKVGDLFGNMIAGRDAYNGKSGDFWDNFNPFSKYGAASIGQSLNMGLLPQTMMGGLTGGGGGGVPGLGGGLPLGLRRGGLVPHRDAGGLVPPSFAGASPQVQQLYQHYAQMPLEQLQRLAVMSPPSSPQGQMIARALQAKRMAPASTGAYPSAQGLGMPAGAAMAPNQEPAQSGYADGGLVPHRANGGPSDPVTITGGLVPQLSYKPGPTGMVGPTWAPGQPYLGSPAGSPATSTASTAPVSVTQLPSSVLSPSPPPAVPMLPLPLVMGATPLRRGGLVPHFAGDDGETQAVPDLDNVVVDPANAPNDLSDFAPSRGQAPFGQLGIDPWLALMSAGAGMMASRSPTLLGGLGEGALAGIGNLGAQHKEAALERYRQADLDARNRRIAIGDKRANAPHLDPIAHASGLADGGFAPSIGTADAAPRVANGDTVSIVYSNGNALDTGLANPMARSVACSPIVR
jgi:hypothetical protein